MIMKGFFFSSNNFSLDLLLIDIEIRSYIQFKIDFIYLILMSFFLIDNVSKLSFPISVGKFKSSLNLTCNPFLVFIHPYVFITL